MKKIEIKRVRRTKMHKHKLEENRDKGHIPHYHLFFIMSFVVCFMLLFAGVGVASATDYYVAVGGNNADTGLSLDHAWATPSHAAQQAQAGDTIYLMDGTWYDEHVVFANSGTEGNPITMKAYSGTPTLDGVDGTGGGIEAYGPDYINIIGITVKNYQYQISFRQSTGSHVLNCKAYPDPTLSGSTSGIILSEGCHYCSIENCTVVGNAWNSIQLVGRDETVGLYDISTHLTIRNNTVYDNTLHGLIDFLGSVDHVTIEGNTLGHMDYDSGVGIFMHQGVVTNINIINNTLINCAYAWDSEAVFLNNVKNGYVAGNHIYHTSTGMKVYHDLINPENITFYDNEVHDCRYYGAVVYPAASDITFDQNNIYDTSYSSYRIFSDSEILNQKGTTFSVFSQEGAAVTIEFSDGRTFSVDGVGEYTTYTITSGAHTIDIHGVSSVGNISGTVTDAGTGLGIEGATVTVGGTGKSGETDINGNYAITDVPVGTYTVTCTATGYESASKENVNVNEGETTTENFTLTKETTPPTITAHSPTGASVPVATTITVTFSEAMNQSSAEGAFSISPSVLGSFSWNGDKMIFTPSSDLAYETIYTVNISTEAKDLTGNNLESPYSWTFTTRTASAIVYVATDGTGDYNCDGIDDHIEINQATSYIDSIGGGTVHLKTGTYIFNGVINIYSNMAFEGDGEGSTILKLKDQNNQAFWGFITGDGISNTLLQKFKVDGNKDSQSGVGVNDNIDAFHIYYSDNVTIQHVTCENVITDHFEFMYSNDCVVRNCTSRNSWHDGTVILACERITVSDNFAWNLGNVGARIYNSNNCVVERNRYYTGDFGILVNTEGSGTYGNNIYRDNYIDNQMFGSEEAIRIHAEGNTIIKNETFLRNIIDGSPKEGFNLIVSLNGQLQDIKIINNVVTSCSQEGIYLEEGTNIAVKNSIIVNNNYGIYGNVISTYNDFWNNANGNHGGGASAGTGDIYVDPLFADSANGDFYLKSTAGRWNGSAWVNDSESSLCIDAGVPYEEDPVYGDYSNEPEPNGGRINMGAYGNTDEASKSGGPDTTPPTITAHSPTGTSVPVGTTITVTFSEAMNKSSALNAFSISPLVTGSFSWDSNKMIFTPDSNLDYETTYVVNISTEAEDLAGNNLESLYSWQFTTLPSGMDLVGEWHFDEGSGTIAVDSSENGNNGTISDSLTMWTTRGKINTALQFNGDNYVEVPDSSSLDSITNNITLIAWVKTYSFEDYQNIVEKWDFEGVNQRSFELKLKTDGTVNWGISPDGTSTNAIWLTSNGIVNANAWTHLAVTSDGETMKIFINGEEDQNKVSAPSGGIYKSTADLHIGRWWGGESWIWPFNGTIDEVKIYNRALSADEIRADYEAGSEDTTPPASISYLQNTTGTTWINWTWDNPTDADFNHTMVYLDGIFKTNTSNSYYNATGLIANTSYEIGTHTVDTNGNVNTTWVNQTTKTLTVPNSLPTAFIDSITPDPAEQAKDTVSFSGHGTDTDGSVVAYNWSSSIDGLLSTANSFSKPASELSVGTHTIYFKVQDDDGAWSTEVTEDLTINSEPANQPPVADPNGPYTGTEGNPLTFDGSGSYDTDGSIVSYEWDFGDGNTFSGVSPTHIYAQNGTYTVALTVTDNEGATDTNTATATIADTEPTADFSATPTSGPEPLTVAFTDNSTSYDGITAWDWDFDNDSFIDSTARNPTHVYAEEGKYNVSLAVYESDGDSDTITKTDYITVTTAPAPDTIPPIVTNPNATPSLIPDDTDNDPRWGEIAQLNVTVTDDSDILSVTINLSQIGGSSVQPMANIGGNIWSVTTNASANTARWNGTAYEPYCLQVNATDIYENPNTSVCIELMVMKNGDVTGDGIVDFGDGIRLVNHDFNPEDPMYSLPSDTIADVTGDGIVDFGDGIRLINHDNYPEDPSYILK